MDLGGFAGGEKYITQGILFKFASDKYGLYGGDEYAMKAAGHELKGLMGFYKCQVRSHVLRGSCCLLFMAGCCCVHSPLSASIEFLRNAGAWPSRSSDDTHRLSRLSLDCALHLAIGWPRLWEVRQEHAKLPPSLTEF